MPLTLLVIAGPTAVGKTDLAISLAQRLGTAIISADSRQCYREMTIGTAKPTLAELASAKHYFINSHTLTDDLTAVDFETLALSYLDEIFANNDTAILSGGTGLYIKALCDGLDAMPQPDAGVEAAVNNQYAQYGLSWLQQAVQEEDPLFYNRGEIQNPARLLRALIFKRSAGCSILDFRTGEKKSRPFRIIKAGLELPRDLLYSRINTRTDRMMDKGLLEEVKGLNPLHREQWQNKALATVGYAELFDYLEGKISLEQAVDKIKQHSRNYAKRQMTWFRKDEEIKWFDARSENLEDQVWNLLKI